MTKKHLITCSVIVVLVIISTLNIFSSAPAASPVKYIAYTPPALLLPKPAETGEAYNFADEALPLDDKKVDYKLQRSIAKHRYKIIQSNVLHAKADKLFPIIEPILKAYGIPDDFKYVPLVESGLRGGTSPKGARGIWQFMPGTARTYGLRVNRKIDERLNLKKSTVAACKYIKELYQEFNSWTLAAAAYNNGSVKLERAIDRQNEDNYFRMSLNRETGTYVYKLIAMKEIINNPEKYGYKNFYSYNQRPLPFMLAYN
ncbi:lytic transglycosylase domain-containing protein [Mucilaginibacter litoreus]|uniref:Lytic transglycosylase domain-containing protein n=1 Tax=Mucilaginibacter litoreus TaxID=1048221 RepID=A0ABW3AWQ9_9SPHI